MKKNTDVRNLIKEAGLYQWMVAEKLGVSDTTLVRWLRSDLSDEKKQLILVAIDELKSDLEKAKSNA